MLKFTKLAIATLAAISLAACSDDDASSAVVTVESAAEYEVTVKNLTNYQPFSPITVLLHDSGSLLVGSVLSPLSLQASSVSESVKPRHHLSTMHLVSESKAYLWLVYFLLNYRFLLWGGS